MNIKIIEYQEEFFEKAIRIFRDSLGEDRVSATACIKAHTKNLDSKFWLAVEDNNVLGLLAFHFEKWNMIGQVDMIGVDSSAKGKGVGKMMMQEAYNYGSKNGLRKIYVDTDESNINAQIFYIKCGYFPEYSMKDYYKTGLSGITFSIYL